MAKQKTRANWVKEAEDLGIVVEAEMTIKDIKKALDRIAPATKDQMTIGEALRSHARCKELRFYLNYRTTQWRGGLTKDQKDEGTKLLTELGLPVPK